MPPGAVDALPPADALATAAAAKAYSARAARSVCETAIQVHGGIGNTRECLAHVHLRWALLSTDVLGGIEHGPEGSVDKLLMTWTEQTVGHASLAVGGTGHGGADDTWFKVYLYSRAQSVMGGTSQIQRNLIARRILGLPT